MVKILSNGDIVPDDDPRANTSTSRGREEGGTTGRPRARQGFVRHDDDDQNQQYGQVSIFTSLNQRLLDGGVPRWNAGPYVIEPIVSVGFLVAGLVFGLKGLLFGAILFFVVKYSQGNRGPSNHGGASHSSRPATGGGGGYTLGRS